MGGTKTSQFNDFWIFCPWEPLFMDFDIPNYFKKYKKIWKYFRTYYFCNFEIVKMIFFNSHIAT